MDWLVEEIRDADSTPGDGSDEYGTRDTIVSGDYTETSSQDLAKQSDDERNRQGCRCRWPD